MSSFCQSSSLLTLFLELIIFFLVYSFTFLPISVASKFSLFLTSFKNCSLNNSLVSSTLVLDSYLDLAMYFCLNPSSSYLHYRLEQWHCCDCDEDILRRCSLRKVFSFYKVVIVCFNRYVSKSLKDFIYASCLCTSPSRLFNVLSACFIFIYCPVTSLVLAFIKLSKLSLTLTSSSSTESLSSKLIFSNMFNSKCFSFSLTSCLFSFSKSSFSSFNFYIATSRCFMSFYSLSTFNCSFFTIVDSFNACNFYSFCYSSSTLRMYYFSRDYSSFCFSDVI